MVEVRTTILAFKAIVKRSGNVVFESRGLVATVLEGMFVIAEKKRPNRLFLQSLPLQKLGYSGISGSEWGGCMTDDIETAMRDLVESLNAEEIKILRNILKE